jgi:hypothetical protein
MAYIPDEWVMRRLNIAQSAQQILFYYCGRADGDSGETNVSPERTSQDLGIRKDHVNEHDRKLSREGFIMISTNEHGSRIVRLLSPWQPRNERNGQHGQRTEKKRASQDLGKHDSVITQDLGSALDGHPNLGEVTQSLGESTQVLGKIAQDLGAHIRTNQTINQTNNQHGADAPTKGKRSRPKEPKPERQPDPVHSAFAQAFTNHYETPYMWQEHDFVKLANLRKTCEKNSWELTEARFAQALRHYFETEQGSHTLADLCARFSTFYRSALNQFGKPVGGNSTNGAQVNGAADIAYPPIVSAPADWRKAKPKEQVSE